jgi:RHS repeat-associated protein
MFASQPRGYFASYKFNPLQQGGSYSSQPDGTDGIDTYILNTSPTTNNGTAVVMWVGESNNAIDKVARSLIKFDLSSIPSNTTITSATLSLWTDADFSDNDRWVRVYRLKVPFNESQATWNEASTGVSWQSPGASGANDRESTAIGSVQILANESLDVEKQISLSTAQIQEMVSGAFTNNGFIIIADTELDDRFNYRTSDASAATKRPKLVIEYTTSSSTPTPTNTPTPGPSPTPTNTPTATPTNPPPANFNNATFMYDGDGKRVKSIFNGTTTTYFVGNHYEVTGSTITKYYYAGSQRIAMRTNGTLNYLLGDHLGSTSLTTNASGQVVSELRYKAWGETRYTSGSTATKYQYTGQYSYESDFGLHFYNARWYDSSLSRFAQADSIVPGPSNSQAWDRYAYSLNNPILYTDPSGHLPCLSCDSIVHNTIDSLLTVLLRFNAIKNAPAITEPRSSLPASPAETTTWIVNELNTNAASEYTQEMSSQIAESSESGGPGLANATETWVSLTRPGAVWDFKPDIRANNELFWLDSSRNVQLGADYQTHYEALANIHYGYAGSAAGFNAFYLQAGAGFFQQAETRGPITTFLDDPYDNYWIRFGIFLYNEYGTDGLTEDEFNNALNGFLEKYGDPGKPIKGADDMRWIGFFRVEKGVS